MNDNHPPRTTPLQRRLALLAFALSVVAGAGLATCAKAAELSGSATAIDGDDLALTTVEHGLQRIRLWGVDAPELRQTCRRGGESWSCGAEAHAALGALVQGQQVVCEGRARWHVTSVWRVKRQCFAGGVDLGEQLVLRGLAVSRRPHYEPAQETARIAGAGMWEGCFRDPSWWRKHLSGELGNGC